MITPEELRKKALRLYPEILRAALSDGSPLFPLVVPADRGSRGDSFARRREDIELLYRESKNRTGRGYTIELKERATRKEGRQSVVHRLLFESLEDYFAFTKRGAEYARFVREAKRTVSSLPELGGWILENPLAFAACLGEGEWEGLAAVCRYFKEHPRPGCYIRELPVAVHTKFVEEHQEILRKLLDRLLPPEAIRPEAADFASRYYLRSAEQLLRVRLLDPSLSLCSLSEIGVTWDGLAGLSPPWEPIFVVENLTNYVAFPEVRGAACIWGSGFAVSRLAELPWIGSRRVVYWGDIDAAGFAILASLRARLPRVEALLMDGATYEAFRGFATSDAASVSLRATVRASQLTDAETALFEDLQRHPDRSRLEQERISQEFLLAKLRERGFRG